MSGGSGTNLRSNLANAKNHGSAKEGVSHWINQRITAIIIAPLSIWFLCNFMVLLSSAGMSDIIAWFSSPVNTILSLLLFSAVFLHASLGIQVVIEDYVHAKKIKYFTLIKARLAFLLMSVICIISILKLHFAGTAGFGF